MLFLIMPFFNAKKLAEPQVLPLIEFSFNILPRYTLTASLQKCLKISPQVICLLLEKPSFMLKYRAGLTQWRTKILVSPVRSRILKFWDTLWADAYRNNATKFIIYATYASYYLCKLFMLLINAATVIAQVFIPWSSSFGKEHWLGTR